MNPLLFRLAATAVVVVATATSAEDEDDENDYNPFAATVVTKVKTTHVRSSFPPSSISYSFFINVLQKIREE